MPLVQSVQYQNKSFRILDLREIHPSGNKHFKLKNNIEHAISAGAEQLLSFGGAWSNHIHALAHIGSENGLKTIGVIRGEKPPQPGEMLEDVANLGMQLHFVTRSDYRLRNKPEYLQALTRKFGDFHLMPEGGSNELGVAGASEIVNLLQGIEYQRLVIPLGTGGTLAGIARALPQDKEVTGVCVLKGANEINQTVAEWAPDKDNWQIDHQGHYGGYAKCPSELKQFILDFEQTTGISLEPVYTGKMIYRLIELMEEDPRQFNDVIAIHTGGMQGRRGFDF